MKGEFIDCKTFQEKNEWKLFEVSNVAKRFKDGACEVCELIDPYSCNGQMLSFHPTGKCGCIELGDDYIFGIRCSHLLWADGTCEELSDYCDDEEIIDDEESYDPNYSDTVMIMGNHKGNTWLKVIHFMRNKNNQ